MSEHEKDSIEDDKSQGASDSVTEAQSPDHTRSEGEAETGSLTSGDSGSSDAGSDHEDGNAGDSGAPREEGLTPEKYEEAVKRWKGAQSALSKLSNQQREAQRQWEEREKALQSELAKFKERQEHESLPVYDRRHPQHSSFQDKVSKVTEFQEQLRVARSDDERNAIAEVWARRGLTDNDIQEVMQYRAKDPRDLLEPEIESRVSQALEEYDRKRAAEEQQRQVVESIKGKIRDNMELFQAHGDEASALLSRGMLIEDVIAHLKVVDRAQKLESKLTELTAAPAGTEKAKRAAAEQATRGRSPGTVTADDILAEANEECKRLGVRSQAVRHQIINKIRRKHGL